tara:strand:+ start:395 stop:1366 length:972 start_codon:yes stop_codon:yes gene_type:complete
MKAIVWGFPLHTHTHSYVHAAVFKAFQRLGYDAYWFHDGDYPSDFDFSNCIFYTEGYADKNIPINKSSTYFVHVCINPKKYLDRECRLIDIRYNVSEIFDVNYHYVRDPEKVTKISDCLYYEKLKDDSGLINRQFPGQEIDYEAAYLTWATDLFPEEIKDEFADIQREPSVYWLGTLGPSNIDEVRPFAEQCFKNGIQFVHNDPWSKPLEFDEAMRLTQVSYLAPDIRGSGDHPVHTGTNHLKTGYVACRQFKNISYGQLGMTNSETAQRVLEGTLIYNSDTAALFHDGMAQINNKKLILEQMQLVREKHTWLARLKELLEIL